MEKVHVEIEKLQDNGLYVNCRDIKMFFTNIIQEDFANIEIFMLNSNPSPDFHITWSTKCEYLILFYTNEIIGYIHVKDTI